MYVMYTGIGSGFPTKLLHYLFRSNCQRLCGCVHEELAFMYVFTTMCNVQIQTSFCFCQLLLLWNNETFSLHVSCSSLHCSMHAHAGCNQVLSNYGK